MLRTLVGTAFLLLFCISAAFAQTGQTISVAAAANLQSVFTNKIIPAFESKSAVTVVPVFGATKGLEQQMENGAPFDVFVSADTDTVAKLAGENLLEAKSIKPYAIGTLVLWARNDAGVRPKSMKDLTNPGILHIAIANPKTAPYGAAAIESLANAKLLDILTPKIVYAENIQQSLQYAVTGNA
jgi:molybdate transport system substrate-binding protein